MDDEDFEGWKICWKLNLLFHTPVNKTLYCILCEGVEAVGNNSLRSTFWREATRCSAGHGQRRTNEAQIYSEPGICSICDQNYVFETVKGKHACWVEDCRRTLRINTNAVRWKLLFASGGAVLVKKDNDELLRDILTFVEKSQVYDCIVCCEEVPYPANMAMAYKPPAAACKHDRNVCDTCLKSTFETAIRGGKFQNLICPDTECKSPIPKESIRPHVSPDAFRLYSKKLANDALAKNQNFRWCTCGKGQVHGPGESKPEWKCLSCNKRHCFLCAVQTSLCSHLQAIDALQLKSKLQNKQSALLVFASASKRKEEAAFKARENEDATLHEIARTTKKCPKAGCGNKIERNKGCGHFTCKKCGTYFCWTCKVIWPGGRSLHLNTCTLGNRTVVAKTCLSTIGYAAGWDRDVGYDLSLDRGLFLMAGHM